MFRLKLLRTISIREKTLPLIVACLLSYLQVVTFRQIGKGFTSEQVMRPLPFQDSPLYLFQLKRFLEGNFSFGDGAILERVNSGYSAGSSFIFALWGVVGNLLNLNLLNTYTLMVFLSSALLYLATYIFLKDLGIEKKSALYFAIPIYILAFGFELGRPSPTQQTLWLVIFAFSRVVKLANNFSTGNGILVNAFLVILLLCNPVYGLAVYAFYFLSIIRIPGRSLRKLSTILPASLAFLGFNIFKLKDLTPEQVDQLSRFGVFYSRLPGAFNSSIQLFCMAIILGLMHKKYSPHRKMFLFNLNLAILAALNSQVLTNTNFEMQSHLGYLVRFALLVSLVSILVALFKVNYSRARTKVLTIVLVVMKIILALVMITFTVFRIDTRMNIEPNLKFDELIGELSKNVYANKVFIVSEGSFSPNDISYLALNTHIKLYWYPEAVFSVISDRELFERFACTLKKPIGANEVQNYANFLFAHKYINPEQFYTKWNSLLGNVGLKTHWRADKTVGYKEAEIEIAKFQKLCEEGRYTKVLHYVIDENLIIRDVSPP